MVSPEYPRNISDVLRVGSALNRPGVDAQCHRRRGVAQHPLHGLHPWRAGWPGWPPQVVRPSRADGASSVRALSAAVGRTPTYLVSRYSSMPSAPPSRPKPDAFTPPNGAAGLDTMPWLIPTIRLDALHEMPRGARSRVKAYAARPYSVSLARSTASSWLVEGRDRRDRSEDLLVEHARVRGYVAQHRRRVEPAAIRGSPPTSRWRRVHGLGDERCHGVAPSPSINGPTCTPASVPRPVTMAPMREASRSAKSSATLSCDEEAVGRSAGLPHVAHLGEHRAVNSSVEVGVGEHEERRIAAELHRHAQQAAGPTARRGVDPRRSSR